MNLTRRESDLYEINQMLQNASPDCRQKIRQLLYEDLANRIVNDAKQRQTQQAHTR